MALLQCMNNAMVNHELAMNTGLNRQLGQQIVANLSYSYGIYHKERFKSK